MGNGNMGDGDSGLALGLVIAGFFIPLIGIIMTIIGLVLAHKAKAINPKDGMALAALIIGYISLFFFFLGLIVVTIIGVLMFNVDFDSVLPNKIDMNNNIRADPVSSNLSGDELKIVFTYVGTRRITIDINGTIVTDYLNSNCLPIEIKNLDTFVINNDTKDVVFSNGQMGTITFKCENSYVFKDVLEGEMTIVTTDLQRGIKMPSRGLIILKAS